MVGVVNSQRRRVARQPQLFPRLALVCSPTHSARDRCSPEAQRISVGGSSSATACSKNCVPYFGSVLPVPRAFAAAFLTLYYGLRPTARRKRVVRNPERRFPDRSRSHCSAVFLQRQTGGRCMFYARSLNSDVSLSFTSSVAVRERSYGCGRRRGRGPDDPSTSKVCVMIRSLENRWRRGPHQRRTTRSRRGRRSATCARRHLPPRWAAATNTNRPEGGRCPSL